MSIVINDLEAGLELDREALTALRGGCTSNYYNYCFPRREYGGYRRKPYDDDFPYLQFA